MDKQVAFDLDEALDSLDLTFNGYVPSQDALEFFSTDAVGDGGGL